MKNPHCAPPLPVIMLNPVYSREPFDRLIQCFGEPEEILWSQVNKDSLLFAETKLEQIPTMISWEVSGTSLIVDLYGNGSVEYVFWETSPPLGGEPGTQYLFDMIEALPPEWQEKFLFNLDLFSRGRG